MEYGRMENDIILHGRLDARPYVSHCNHGETFWGFPLSVSRLSGTADRLNVLVPERMLAGQNVDCGDEVSLRGEVRSFNNRSGQGSRLVITVLARTMVREEGEDDNRLTLTGTLCKPPIFRCTPLGRNICDMMLAVNRRYGRSDYLPCISWGTLAHRCAALSVGDSIRLEGRLQSRTYTKNAGDSVEERTAFEVSVMTILEE
jgi:primosomal replication protein N